MGSPGLFSRKSLREFRYSHARRHAIENLDFIRSSFAHELFGLPLTALCARASERAPNRRFVLFAPKTSFTVTVVVKGTFLGLLCRIFTQILENLLRFSQIASSESLKRTNLLIEHVRCRCWFWMYGDR